MVLLTYTLLSCVFAATVISDRQDNVINIHDSSSATNSGISFGVETVKKTTPQISLTKNVTKFSSATVSGAVKLKIVPGKKYQIEISGSDADVKQFSVKVEQEKLVIEKAKNFNQEQEVKIQIIVPELTELNLTGAVDCEAEISGQEKFVVYSKAAGEIFLSGHCGRLIINIDGAVNLDASALAAETAVINAAGATNVKVNASKALDASASGAASIYYKNNPEKIVKNIDGAGSVNPIE